MTDDEFTKLKQMIIDAGGAYSGPDDRKRPYDDQSHYWYSHYCDIYVKYVSPKSKYNGSVLTIYRIVDDKIHAFATMSGAPRINPTSHFKNYELTTETKIKYVDGEVTNETIKDFFDDDIEVGDYVFGEHDREAIFGIVRTTKKGTGEKKKYGSKKLQHDAAMIEIIKSKNKSYDNNSDGELKLLEMKYFIKIEDPTLYLLKL